MRYLVKCDDCQQTIRETDEVRESYAGGRCQAYRDKTDARHAHLRGKIDGCSLRITQPPLTGSGEPGRWSS